MARNDTSACSLMISLPRFSPVIMFSFSYGYWTLGYSYEDYEQLVRKLEVVLVETGPKSRF